MAYVPVAQRGEAETTGYIPVAQRPPLSLGPASAFAPLQNTFKGTVAESSPQTQVPADGEGFFPTINPLKPVTVRPLFASDKEKTELPFGGPVIGAVHDLAARTIEAIPRVLLTALANARSITSGGAGGTVQAPFDVSRIGIENKPVVLNSFSTQKEADAFAAANPGTQVKPVLDTSGFSKDEFFTKYQVLKSDNTVQNTGARYLKAIQESGFTDDPSPANLFKALGATFGSAGADALDAVLVGDLATAGAKGVLQATRYSPELDQALQQLGLKGKPITLDVLKQTFIDKANRLAQKQDWQGFNELGRATNTVVQNLSGRGIPALNRIGQLAENTARIGLQDAGQGLKLNRSMYAELAPETAPRGLPGYREEPGQAPAMGLSTQRVERVGGEENPEGNKVERNEAGEVIKVTDKEGNVVYESSDSTPTLERQENVPETAQPITPQDIEHLPGADEVESPDSQLATLRTAESKKLLEALVKDGTISIYLPREKGMTLEPGTEVEVFKPVADNVLTEGILAHRFSVNARDLSFDPETKKVYYNSPEVQSAIRGEKEKPFYLGIGDEPTMLIDKDFPEGIEVNKVMREIQEEAKGKFTKEQLDNMRGMFNEMKEAIMLHPGRKLSKYANKNGELPEVTGKPTSKFSQEGDKITQELGYEDSETAREDYQGYKQQLAQFKEAQETLRGNVREARDFSALDRARKQLLSTYRNVSKAVETARIKSLQQTIRHELVGARATTNKQGLRTGKYTPEIQKKLEKMERYIDMDRLQAGNKILQNLQAYAGPEGTTPELPDAVKEDNEMLSMAGALRPRDARILGADGLENIIENIRSVKETGKTLREQKNFNKRTEIARQQDKAVDVITGGQGVDPFSAVVPEKPEGFWSLTLGRAFSSYLNAHRGFDSMMEFLSRFDKKSAPYKSFLNTQFARRLDKARNIQTQGVKKNEELFQGKFGEIFGVKPGTKEFRNEFRSQLEPKKIATITDVATGKKTTLEMNRFQLRKKWMEMQDPTLRDTFVHGMGWSPEIMRFVEDAMTPEDMAFATWQLKDFYPNYYKDVNEVYEDMTGASLGFRHNYSPIKRRVINTVPEYVQMAKDMLEKATAKSGSLKMRTQNIEPLEYIGDFQTLQKHVVEMEHFKAYTDLLTDFRRIFSGQVKEAIRQFNYPGIIGDLDKFINDLARDGVDNGKRIDFLDTGRSNVATSFLGLNPLQIPKQVAGFITYLSEPGITTASYFRHFFGFWGNPVKNGRMLIEKSPYLQARYDLGEFDRDVKLAMGRDAARIMRGNIGWRDKALFFSRLGDRLTSLIGGYPIYKINYASAIAAGKTAEQADKEGIEAMEIATKRTQGSGNVEDLGPLQRSGSIGNLFTLFLNNPIAQWRLAEESARNLGLFEKFGGGSARGSRMENLRRLFVIWIVAPMLFQFVADGFQWRGKRQTRAAVLGPLGYPIFFGDVLDTIARSATGDDVFADSYTPAGLTALSQLGKTGSEAVGILNSKTKLEDLYQTLEDLATLASSATGIPVNPLKNAYTGASNMVSGKDEDPRQLIYSQYALDKSTKKKKTPAHKSGFPSLPDLPPLPALPKLPPLPQLP